MRSGDPKPDVTPTAPWMSDRATPAVVLRFEKLDTHGKAVLVRVGDDEAVAVWLPEGIVAISSSE